MKSSGQIGPRLVYIFFFGLANLLIFGRIFTFTFQCSELAQRQRNYSVYREAFWCEVGIIYCLAVFFLSVVFFPWAERSM